MTALPEDALGVALLGIARRAIRVSLGLSAEAIEPSLPALEKPGASFVTLTQNGRLRGCIGSLEAHRPLGEDVAANARAAALHDPRFPALTAGEWPITTVEVSHLHPAEPLPACNSAEAACQLLRPGRDGIILTARGHRATFLPQVWESLPDAMTFLRELRRKAGLDANDWPDDLRLARYSVDKYR